MGPVPKSFYSAIVVIPPENLWPQIEKIRKNNDKAYRTWMPHINLMFPFLKYDDHGRNFRDATKKISNQLPRTLKPFKIGFTRDSFSYFNKGRTSTVHLRPLEVKTILRKTRWAPIDSSDENNSVPLSSTVPENPLPPEPPEPLPNLQPIEVTSTYIQPVIPIPQHFRNLPTPSLSSLKDAIWTDDDIEVDRSWRIGLGCRDPTATFEPTFVSHTKLLKRVEPETEVYPQNSNVSKRSPSPNWWPEVSDRSSDSSDDFEEMLRRYHQQAAKEKPRSEKNQSEPVHQGLAKLQAFLNKLYPDMTEESRKGSGFQPHLTLGQCNTHDVDEIMDGLKEDWQDIVFEVQEFHLISRAGRDDRHEIRETIKLRV